MTRPLIGSCAVPGDKSISHRAAILGALAVGTSRVRGFSGSADCASTLGAVESLGVPVERTNHGDLLIRGPLDDARRDVGTIDCGRAGTAMRLLAGVVASLPITAVLTGHPQLLRRPMSRVADPLVRMGASITLTRADLAPMRISGGGLHGIDYELPVPSAQVKSALLLAALRADGPTSIREPAISRDHTERMLRAMGASVRRRPDGVAIDPGRLDPLDVTVPGDPSGAAFLCAAAALVPRSNVTVPGVGLNPTRLGFVDVLRRMGGDVECTARGESAGEPLGDVRVRYAPLDATTIQPSEVGLVIDELPLVGLVATQASGTTEVRGAGELRVKESDRIAALVRGLRALGAEADELPDGFAVHGPTPLHAATVDGRQDHRMAMTFAVASLIADGPVRVDGLEFAGDSFLGFHEALAALGAAGPSVP